MLQVFKLVLKISDTIPIPNSPNLIDLLLQKEEK